MHVLYACIAAWRARGTWLVGPHRIKKPRADPARGFVMSRSPESAFFATCLGRGLGREELAGENEAGANAGDGGKVEEHDRHVQ